VVEGISKGSLITVGPADFSKIDVDASYQRGETKMVNDIIRAIQAGGAILDPVTLCRRPWDKDKAKLWIIDGHQRMCAAQELLVSLPAIVHESASLDAEKTFFLALNSKRSVSSDNVVKGWVGPSGDLIRKVNDDPSHPLYNRVHFQHGRNRSRIASATLICGALIAATGLTRSGNILRRLARLDNALSKPIERARAEQFLRLMGHIFTVGAAPALAMEAIGLVANERWAKEVIPAPLKTIQKLRLVNWKQEVPTFSKRFLPVLADTVRKVWK